TRRSSDLLLCQTSTSYSCFSVPIVSVIFASNLYPLRDSAFPLSSSTSSSFVLAPQPARRMTRRNPAKISIQFLFNFPHPLFRLSRHGEKKDGFGRANPKWIEARKNLTCLPFIALQIYETTLPNMQE